MESFMPAETIAHMVELLDAALPYVNGNAKHSMELIRKAGDLSTCLSSSSQSSDLSACDLDTAPQSINMEGLLENLQKVGNPQEKDFIHMILNFIKARNLYTSYQTFQQTHPVSEDTLSAASCNGHSTPNNRNSINMILEFLLSQLTPEQQKNFEMIQTLF